MAGRVKKSNLQCDVSQAVASVGHHPLCGYCLGLVPNHSEANAQLLKLQTGRIKKDSQLPSGSISARTRLRLWTLARDGHVGGSDVAAQP